MRDLVTLLHLPYTAWHLSYVAIGAALASELDGARLAWTLAAFLLAVGVAAHCLDELHGRPLGTTVPRGLLIASSVAGLGAAIVIGLGGVRTLGAPLLALMLVGVALVLAYNLELFGGALHNDAAFALAWGGFPVLVGGFAQTGSIELAVLIGAAFATATSLAQRHLSSWARGLRRRLAGVQGTLTWRDGSEQRIDVALLVAPAEAALRLVAAAHVLLAIALLAAR